MKHETAIVWFRKDLRIADNPALYHAVSESETVLPVFIWSPQEAGEWSAGAAHRWWLHHALASLDQDLRDKGSRLLYRTGGSLDALQDLIGETHAEAVYWNKCYDPALRRRDRNVAEAFHAENTYFSTFEARLLHNPDHIETTSGGPYHVYTPFWNKLKDTLHVPPPLDPPRMGATRAPSSWPGSADLDDLGLLPEIEWAGGLHAIWLPGEQAAHERLDHFTEHLLNDYEAARDRPARDGTSRLSPYLHHGELSPRQIWHAVNDWVQNAAMKEQAEAYLQELAWREFSYHLLYHYPETPLEPLRTKFDDFNWRHAPKQLERWQQGQTGYPIVDAAMRQLWEIGWMHNRTRMITASFLTKDLLIYWQDGARWFWDTLVDGDLANNTMGWQWTAGCGADAQPFFRIFNPVSQGKKHDPDGHYVRRWVPELADLPTEYIHTPWETPREVLEEADLTLGEDYPAPMVDHSEARDRALSAYNKIK